MPGLKFGAKKRQKKVNDLVRNIKDFFFCRKTRNIFHVIIITSV